MRRFSYLFYVVLLASSLFAKESGKDELTLKIQNEECGNSWSSWKCSRCGRFNLEGVGGCAYCGKPRNG